MRKNKIAPPFVAGVFIIIVLAIVFSISMIGKYSPSKEMADMQKYFGFEGDLSTHTHLSMTKADEVAIIINDEQIKGRGILIDGKVYLPAKVVQEYLNSRFYWDSYENVLLYTTPTEIIRAEVGSSEYSIGKNKQAAEAVIVKTEGSEVYIEVGFVQAYSNIDYQLSIEPNHMQIITQWGDKNVVNAKKDAVIRQRGGIKSSILKKVKEGETLFIIEELENWTKVRSQDGVIGYISKKQITASRTENYIREFAEPIYTSIKKDYTINMAWHQVFNSEGNNKLSNIIADVKGVNTISPTWFSLADNEGNIKSIASTSYVNLAHRCGMEVWALVDNFGADVSTRELLKYTSKRERLINQLISAAIEYNLDGLNIDFESLPQEAGGDFIQFVRELSTKCRINGIVLSIDNYVPGYTGYYNRAEQGVVADYVIIMGYDETTTKSEKSGSVASIGYVRQGIEDTLKEVPAEKIINAIPFYTRLWKETPKTQEQTASEDANSEYIPYTLSCETLGMRAMDKVIGANGLEQVWDEARQQYYIEYIKDGITYKSWLEEERSIEAKLKLIKEYKLAGVAEWKIGLEKSSIWDVIIKYTN